MMFSMDDITWAAVECERQKTGLGGLVRMIQALERARKMSSALPTPLNAMDLARIVEPQNEFYLADPGDPVGQVVNYRRTPVVFNNGGGSCPWDMITDAVERWWDSSGAGHREMDRGDCTEFVRGLLSIHPWSGGNGRVAALLFNWVLHGFRGTLEALPDLGFGNG